MILFSSSRIADTIPFETVLSKPFGFPMTKISDPFRGILSVDVKTGKFLPVEERVNSAMSHSSQILVILSI